MSERVIYERGDERLVQRPAGSASFYGERIYRDAQGRRRWESTPVDPEYVYGLFPELRKGWSKRCRG